MNLLCNPLDHNLHSRLDWKKWAHKGLSIPVVHSQYEQPSLCSTVYATDHRDWKLGSPKEFLSLCSTLYVTDLWRLEIALAEIISDHRQYKGCTIHWLNHEAQILAEHSQTAGMKGWRVEDALGGKRGLKADWRGEEGSGGGGELEMHNP